MAVSIPPNADMPMPAFKLCPSPLLTFHLHKQLSTQSICPAYSQRPFLYTPISHTSSAMRVPLFSVLLGLLTTSFAHNIQMGAHQRECFHEVLHKDDKMTVTFQVGDREFGGAGNLELDFWVGAPLSRALCGAETALSREWSCEGISKLCGLFSIMLLRVSVLQSPVRPLSNVC